MLRLGAERDSLSIVGDQIGSPTYAQDIASLVVGLLPQIESNNVESGLYHFCGDTACSWHQFAEEIFSQAKNFGYQTPKQIKSIATKDYPTPAARPLYSVLDCTKIQSTFNIQKSNWRQGISRALTLL